jgi:uncharacterized membrane protein YgaE (UPF0421/DUF939 family)
MPMQHVMLNAVRTLLRTPVPAPRLAAPGARARVVAHLPVVVQTATAAVLAWYLALLLLPSPRPAFASIAAVICLGATYGQRRRQATELVGGVVLGLVIASALLFVIGTGPLQTALLVVLAMTAALVLRGGDVFVNEAAVSAILLTSVQQVDPGFSTDRILEGLIGGGVGLAIASLLLPPDPVFMVNRAAQSVVGKLGHTLQEAAGALEAGDAGRAEQALHAARQIDDDVEVLEDTMPAANETARFSLSRRGDRDVLRRYEETLPQVDYAVRNARVLTRYILRHTRGPEAAPAGLPLAVRELADAVWELGAQYDAPARPTELRPLALSAARHAGRSYESPELTQIAGQVRSVAVDLVRAADQLGEPDAPVWDRPTEELLAVAA